MTTPSGVTRGCPHSGAAGNVDKAVAWITGYAIPGSVLQKYTHDEHNAPIACVKESLLFLPRSTAPGSTPFWPHRRHLTCSNRTLSPLARNLPEIVEPANVEPDNRERVFQKASSGDVAQV